MVKSSYRLRSATRHIRVPATALIMALGFSIVANGQSLRASVIGAGGATTSNASFQLRSTLGQPVVGRTIGTAQSHKAGFWYFLVGDAGTGVSIDGDVTPETSGLPGEYRLDGNYPNPFNPTTTISYDLPQVTDVTLTVADVLGRQVRVLASGTQPAGTHEIFFDATGLPSGIYFYRLEAEDFVETKRMMVVK